MRWAAPPAPWSAVEIDDEPRPAAGPPDPDPDPVVVRVLDVPPVAAVRRLLGLEHQVRCEDRALGGGIAVAAADVLAPVPAQVAGPPEAVARVAVDRVGADALQDQQAGIRPRDLVGHAP